MENKITSGTDSTHFTSGKPCTRAEAMNFMWRAEGSSNGVASGNSTDVAAGSYYAKAVSWAEEEKITSGTSAATFSPNQTCAFLTLLFLLIPIQEHNNLFPRIAGLCS